MLTAATGVVDAVSYIALDRVFTGNMTGNVLFLGFGLVGVADVPFVNNAVALAGFLTGAVVVARVVPRGRADVVPLRSVWVLAAAAVVAGALALVWGAVGELPQPALLATTAALAFLMGGQVSAVKPLGNTDITTVVVTSTLVNLVRDSRVAGASGGQAWRNRVLAVVTLAAGAAMGAVAIDLTSGAAALGAASGVLLLAVGTLALTRRAQLRVASAPGEAADVPSAAEPGR